MEAKIIVFIITYNRLTTLRRTLESYQHFTTPHEIIIIDNGTDDPACLAFLNSLPYKIQRFDKINNMDELVANISTCIKRYYENNHAPYWAVSDCDICFDDTPADTLDAYIRLHDGLNGQYNIGPGVRVDQIPNSYPLKNRVMFNELFDTAPSQQEISNGIRYRIASIDTTFCLYNANNGIDFDKKDRTCKTIRVHNPYWAHHLDWYIDIFNMLPDQIAYMNKTCLVGAYGGRWLSEIYKDLKAGHKSAFEKWLLSTQVRGDHDNYEPYIVAWMYQNGVGCEPNIQESKKWFDKMYLIRNGGVYSKNQPPLEVFHQILYENNMSYILG